MRVYSAAEVHAALPWPRLVQALHDAFVAGAEVPVRHAHALAPEHSLLLMPAWDAQLIITKVVTVLPTAAHTVQATVLVLDRQIGMPLALMDGEALTLRRTAATSALAARHLARADSRRLLIVGSGRLAAWMARAHAALRPALQRIEIWGRSTPAAHRLALELAEEGLPVHVAGDLQTAVQAADIVCCATTATAAVVQGDWLQPGTHVDLVGAFRADMREVDDSAVQRAWVVVDTYAGALKEAGDLVQPLRHGLIQRSHVRGELAELLRNTATRGCGRPNAAAITLFKSVGTALEDLAAAHCVLKAV